MTLEQLDGRAALDPTRFPESPFSRVLRQPLILGLFATFVVAFAAFLAYEPRRKDPLLDLRFFRSVPFSSATVLAMCAFASFAGFLFLNALYLQQVRGYSALHTGLCTLPLALMPPLLKDTVGDVVAEITTCPPPLSFAGSTTCLAPVSGSAAASAQIASACLLTFEATGDARWRREAEAPPTTVPQMTPKELKARLDRGDDLYVLDVREPHEYQICNIGGHLIPLGELPRRVHELDSSQEIVAHCKSGKRSAQAVEVLRGAGFKKIQNLKGGILAWSDEVDPSVPKY